MKIGTKLPQIFLIVVHLYNKKCFEGVFFSILIKTQNSVDLCMGYTLFAIFWCKYMHYFEHIQIFRVKSANRLREIDS